MPSLLQQLNNESLLLLYLADELPADDRVDLEQMLAQSATMRADLDALRTNYAGAMDAMKSADSRDRMVVSSNIASRRVGQAIRSWHAKRMNAPRSENGRRLRFPWWTYPIASAVAVVTIIVSWWTLGPDRGPKMLKATQPMILTSADDDETESSPTTEPWEAFAVARDERDTILAETEDELYALSEPSSSVSEILLQSETNER